MVKIPNIRSAEKRLRQSEKRRVLNRMRKAAVKKVTKQMRLYLASGEKEQARALIPQLAKAADKAAQRHAFHKNKASRIKSRWTRKIQST